MQIQEILLHHLFTRIDICSCIYALAFYKIFIIYETFEYTMVQKLKKPRLKMQEHRNKNLSHQKYFDVKKMQFIEWE